MQNGTKLTQEQVQFLQGTLDPSRVKQRIQGNRNVSYIEGFDVIDTANQIFGFDGWTHKIIGIPTTTIAGQVKVVDKSTNTESFIPGYISRAVVEIGIRCPDGEWIYHQDIGHCVPAVSTAKSFTEPTPDSIETAEKGAVTDAMKRAFRSLGAQFGNSLYDKDDPNHQGVGSQSGAGSGTQSSTSNTQPNKTCPNCGGIMRFKSGKKDGQEWAGHFCDNQKLKGCKPLWPKK